MPRSDLGCPYPPPLKKRGKVANSFFFVTQVLMPVDSSVRTRVCQPWQTQLANWQTHFLGPVNRGKSSVRKGEAGAPGWGPRMSLVKLGHPDRPGDHCRRAGTPSD